MPADPIKFKPKAFGLQVDFIALWRLYFGEKPPAPRVARRFLDVFQAHGIAPAQIQRFLPQITLEYSTSDRLGPVLTNETLDQAAALFGVRREWLEAVDEQMYEPRFCYKAQRDFFEDLARWQVNPERCAVRALCDGELDHTSSRAQPLVLVVVEPIGNIGDEEICRYRVYQDSWNWAHLPCRLQLKATARLLHLGWQTPVPLYRVQPRVLEQIRGGRRVPRFELRGSLLTEPSLEDFALDAHENGQARETDEMPLVLRYVEDQRLPGLLPGK